nr:MAG TPA: hypothetical protein [Caudoviricetes sp.]DAN81379.1 MAG TPA: hypothetical protein [Caudoviricetes sp.]DAY63509.1 MAG TPA: hypothetical protein [Caudoviricetes sp.]
MLRLVNNVRLVSWRCFRWGGISHPFYYVLSR